MMRERFDRIEIVDLRGDVRAGPRGDVAADTGVFSIQVGTAITLAIADGTKTEGELADVFYTDAWEEGRFSRRSKLEWLTDAAGAGAMDQSVRVDRGLLDDMRPAPFQNGEWLSVSEVFNFFGSGIQTKRDEFAYAPTRDHLLQRLQVFVDAPLLAASGMFHPTAARPVVTAQANLAQQIVVRAAAYRPLDRRFVCADASCIDRPRPSMQAAWGSDNICLYTLPSGVGTGPALWAHGLIPDYHSFRGSYGGYALPLYDRRVGPNASNLSVKLIAALGEAYGAAVSAEDIFDAILALLSSTAYTRRFAEDLEDVFPHIPFPASREVFEQAVAIGGHIRALETFARPADAQFRPPAFCRLATQPGAASTVGTVAYDEGSITLCEDDTGRFTGIPQPVWDFAVSGYRVLPRWIDGRKGLPADLALVRDLRDVAARIVELIHRFDEADLVLTATLADTLTRAELGFPAPQQEEDD